MSIIEYDDDAREEDTVEHRFHFDCKVSATGSASLHRDVRLAQLESQSNTDCVPDIICA